VIFSAFPNNREKRNNIETDEIRFTIFKKN